jgi:hypothetical protein
MKNSRISISVSLFTVAAVSGIGLMLASASPAFAGIFSLSINRDAILAPGGHQTTVTGTVGCPADERAALAVEVSKVEGQKIIGGNGRTNQFKCTGSVQNWTVTVNFNAPLHTGRADAVANATAFPSSPPEHEHTGAEIMLH